MLKRAGHAEWLNEFTPARMEYLGFVNRLMQTFCELDICCSLVNTYPAYIAGVFSLFSPGGGKIRLLYYARVDSPMRETIYNKVPSFQIGLLSFTLTEAERYEEFPHYSVFAISQGRRRIGF